LEEGALVEEARLTLGFALGVKGLGGVFNIRLRTSSRVLAGAMVPTKSQIEAQNLYANLLAEVNLRIAAINHCTLGLSGLAPPFVKDFCYLQIRMICELVALGCLVAHGDIKQATSMHKEWQAEKIMNALEKLHPYFYPIAIKQFVTTTPTGRGIHLQRMVPDPLPKSEFLRLYGKCGDMLHRGNVKKLLKGQFPTQINYPEISAKAQKLVDLLSNHVLVARSGEQMFLAMLQNKDDNHNPQVAIAETPRGQPVDFSNPDFLKDPPPK
jgi:hypothetical protein